MKLHLYDIIESPNITEKGARHSDQRKHYFRVHSYATKVQIRQAVEEIFHVQVDKVNTITVHGRWKRVRLQPGKTSDWKKAIVTLKPGQNIDLTK